MFKKKAEKKTEKISYWERIKEDVFNALFAPKHVAILAGEPFAGKTTLLAHLLEDHSKETIWFEFDSNASPEKPLGKKLKEIFGDSFYFEIPENLERLKLRIRYTILDKKPKYIVVDGIDGIRRVLLSSERLSSPRITLLVSRFSSFLLEFLQHYCTRKEASAVITVLLARREETLYAKFMETAKSSADVVYILEKTEEYMHGERMTRVLRTLETRTSKTVNIYLPQLALI